jgi:hypothetical protein
VGEGWPEVDELIRHLASAAEVPESEAFNAVDEHRRVVPSLRVRFRTRFAPHRNGRRDIVTIVVGLVLLLVTVIATVAVSLR